MAWVSQKNLFRLIGVPFLTFLLFVFECSDPRYYLYELLWSFCLAILLWEGNRWINHLLNRYVPWQKHPVQRVFVQTGLSLAFTAWITYFLISVLYNYLYQVELSFLMFRKNLFINSIISFLYSSIYAGEYFFSQWTKSLLETEKLKREQISAQYETLKNQINPHFLFNSLHTLIGLIHEDPELASEYGHHFAKVYRYVLEHRKEELVPLKKEIEIVRLYAFLLESRFGENLQIEWSLDLEGQRKYLPPLTLQMLIENAIKHNVISKEMPLKLEIKLNGSQRLLVRNNLQRKNSFEPSTQIGLDNIQKRYQYLSDHKVIISESRDHFSVELPLLDQKHDESTDH